MNIRALREQAGLTQQQLADRVGVNRSMIAHYEKGLTQPSVPVLVAMAIMLGADLNELKREPYSWAGKAEEPAPDQDTPLAQAQRLEVLLDRMGQRHEAQGRDMEEAKKLMEEFRKRHEPPLL